MYWLHFESVGIEKVKNKEIQETQPYQHQIECKKGVMVLE